ncbi:MAG: ubiquinol-cytochrome c reductase iron-sulfur subunit [Candidatus Binatia bacterium]
MARIVNALSRRTLLKLLFAVPFIQVTQTLLARFLGATGAQAATSPALKVAKASQLKEPWSSARFSYLMSAKSKDVYGKETVIQTRVPGVVIRLPDDLAEKQGGGAKGRYYVVNLHCTHERCETAYLADRDEIKAVSNMDAKNPMAFCPCHRSVFDLAADGKAVKGPAKEPLWKFNFDVKGDNIIVTGMDPKASAWAPGRAGGLTAEYPVRPGEPGL